MAAIKLVGSVEGKRYVVGEHKNRKKKDEEKCARSETFIFMSREVGVGLALLAQTATKKQRRNHAFKRPKKSRPGQANGGK